MKTYTLFALIYLSLLTPSLLAQTSSPIPEEARRHFVMGTTLFKDAKTADDYSQVVNEFKQAADLAPQWPDARYNLGLAKEAAGDYSGAMADLKLYQQFKLSDTEARTVQDKIYALEAKAGAAAKKKADEAAVTHYTYNFYDDFSNNNNNWPLKMGTCVLAIEDGRLNMNALGSPAGKECEITKEFPMYRTKEFELEVTAKWESGRLGSPYGILFCANSRAASSYFFGITANGYIGIESRENNGEWKYIAGPQYFMYVTEHVNVLRIVKKGESIMFYVNGIGFNTLAIEGYGTTFGIFANNGTKVQFSKFKLSGEKQ